MDILQASVDAVAIKIKAAGLKNVRVIQDDALNTRLDTGTLDAVLPIGVIPAPLLPINKLLQEMARIPLKPLSKMRFYAFWGGVGVGCRQDLSLMIPSIVTAPPEQWT